MRREKVTKEVTRRITAKNFLNLRKEYPDPESTDPKEELKEVHTKAHYNSNGKT